MLRSNVVCLTDITFCYEINFLKPASNSLTIHFEENKQAFKIMLLLFLLQHDLLLNTANYSIMSNYAHIIWNKCTTSPVPSLIMGNKDLLRATYA